MKYNPKINEQTASFNGFIHLHPYQEELQVQGALELIYELETALGEITGLPYVSLNPNAGAQGEFVGVLMIKKYFEQKNENRTIAIIPDSAHGTNPASAAMAGLKTVKVRSNGNGTVDIDHLKKLLTPEIACIMLTNPNTLGLFEKDIVQITELVRDNGSLLYYDGANLNAIVGKIKPKDMGFDVIHLNLHKTFSTPHGGGGPGSGPVCVSEKLKDFLPYPRVTKSESVEGDNPQTYYRVESNHQASIGRVRWFYGNFLILVRAYTYILTLGQDGLKQVSEIAVLNASYLKSKLENVFNLPHNDHCMHEFVLSLQNCKEKYGVNTLDFAKRLIDYGIHPPTIYFPLVVSEAMMIEPTETESKATLDNFVEILKTILHEAESEPNKVHHAPYKMPVGRLNEVKAVKEPKLTV